MKFTINEKEIFASGMAMMVKAGFSLEQGIMLLLEECDNEQVKVVLTSLLASLKADNSFYQALKDSQAFDDYMVNLVKIGETSGNLDDVLKSLTKYYQRIDDITYKLKQALTFPVILLMMMLVVVAVIVFKVLPIFRQVLRSLGSDLSSFAYSFMEFGQLFSWFCLIVLTIVVGLLIGIYFYQKNKQENVLVMLIQNAALIKKLATILNQAQLTYALSLFVSSGYDLIEAMEYLPDLISDNKMKEQLQLCNQDLNEGQDFLTVIKKRKIYQGMALNMIQVGFQTGQSDEMLLQLSKYYQNQINERVEWFLNIIEPTIIALLSLIVGIVLLSVMLPLISIMSSL